MKKYLLFGLFLITISSISRSQDLEGSKKAGDRKSQLPIMEPKMGKQATEE